MSESKPWDYHSHLTHEALVAVASLIAQGRSDALIRHNEEIGDDSWTLGCSAFQFARFQITKAATTARARIASVARVRPSDTTAWRIRPRGWSTSKGARAGAEGRSADSDGGCWN